MGAGSSFPFTKLLYSIEDTAELLSLSRATVWRLVETGELPTVRVGRSRRVTSAQLNDFIRLLEQQSGFTRLG